MFFLPPVAIDNSFTLYTTMEPCSKRLSGKESCSNLIIAAKIKNVVIGALEPDIFVADCQGINQLKEKGINVIVLDNMKEKCLAPNDHLLSQSHNEHQAKQCRDNLKNLDTAALTQEHKQHHHAEQGNCTSLPQPILLRALLFDIDGTMCDSDVFHRRVFASMLKPFGYEVDEKFYAQRISGGNNKLSHNALTERIQLAWSYLLSLVVNVSYPLFRRK
jgi:hypothetical protein